MDVGGTSSTSGSGATSRDTAASANDAINNIDLDQFLQLMIAELQNQDPLSPVENSQILEQVSVMREIGATSQMQETLQAVLLGQNLSNASSLVGQDVRALNDDGDYIDGVVDRVSVAGGEVKIHIGNETARLENVSEVYGAST